MTTSYAAAVRDELVAALVTIEGVTDCYVDVTTAPTIRPVELLLSYDDARLLAAQLRWAANDAIDRHEVAAVVEHLVELHDVTYGSEDSHARCGRCRDDAGVPVLHPCRTRQLLSQLPGGAP